MTTPSAIIGRSVERVGAMVKAGKSLDAIKKELRIRETDDWEGKDRFPNNTEAAYRHVTQTRSSMPAGGGALGY